jgi:hypothetical protein
LHMHNFAERQHRRRRRFRPAGTGRVIGIDDDDVLDSGRRSGVAMMNRRGMMVRAHSHPCSVRSAREAEIVA